MGKQTVKLVRCRGRYKFVTNKIKITSITNLEMGLCAAFGCKEVGLYKFPSDPNKRRRWERALRIVNYKSTTYSRLCRRHFKDSDFESVSKTTGFTLQRKFLKKSAVPSIVSWNVGDSQQQTSRALRLQKRNARRSLNYSLNSSTENQADCSSSGSSEPNEEFIVYQDLHDIGFEVEVISDPSSDSKQHVETVQHQHINQGTQTTFTLRLFSKDDLLSDNDSVLYYTGLESYDKFKLVLSTLCPMANDLNYKGSQVISLSIEDQFLILLIKLRRNKPDFELSKYFGVSKTTISNVFVTWLNFTYDLWSLIDIWPSRDLVDYYMPLQFKKYHSKTRVIIDGTEVPITKPKNPTAQQATFSTYKNKNTMKLLVGATPGGLISYCSEGYGGSTSDRQIIERSDLFIKCDSGDSIMADRGFNVQDLFASKDIGINIPTFLRGKTQLSALNVKNDRLLASQRVHIERLIGLSKTFQILKTDLNAYYVPLASRIFFVCVMLCNFREGIIKK